MKSGLGLVSSLLSRLSWSVFLLAGSLAVLIPDEARANIFAPKPGLTSEENSQITDMIETFGGGCSLNSASVQDAISLVKAFTTTLAATKDSSCESVTGVLSRMQMAQIRAEGFMPWIHEDVNNAFDQEVAGYQSQKERILFLMSQTADPAELAVLKGELRITELDLARAQGAADSVKYNERRERQARALRELVGATNASMDQILANQACWANKPNLLRELGAVAVGVGGSVAMATPASETAMLIGAGVQMIAKVIDFVEKFRIQKKINEFNLTLAPTALTCAMERMSEIYCSARDSYRAIEVAGRRVNGDDPVWGGIKLLEEDLPVALAWLEQLRSGGGAASTSEASERFSLAIEEAQLLESVGMAEAIMSEQERTYNQLQSPELKFQAIRNTAISVAGAFCPDVAGVSTSNPLCVVMNADYAPFHLLDITRDERLTLGVPFQNRIFKAGELELTYFDRSSGGSVNGGVKFDASFAVMRIRFSEWYRLAKDRFDVKKSLLVGGDLELTFNKAIPTATGKGPLTSLVKLRDFSRIDTRHTTGAKGRPLSKGHQNIRDRVAAALEIIIENIEGVDQGTIAAADAKAEILKVYRLDRGTTDLRSNIVRIIEIQLDWLVYASGLVPDDLATQWLAAQDYVQELRSFRSGVSIPELRAATKESQRIIRANIPIFFKSFKAPLYKALLSLKGEDAKHTKTLMCFQLLMSDSHGQYFPYDVCDGVQGQPGTERGVSTPVFSAKLFSRKFEDRVCLYRDYLRKNLVIEEQGWLPGREGRVRRISDTGAFANPAWRTLLQRLNARGAR